MKTTKTQRQVEKTFSQYQLKFISYEVYKRQRLYEITFNYKGKRQGCFFIIRSFRKGETLLETVPRIIKHTL